MQLSLHSLKRTRAVLFLVFFGVFVVHPARAVEDPYAFVGSWQGIHKGSGRIGVGTCILISSNWVLTAAHVANPLVKGTTDRVIRISFPGDVKRVAVSAVRVEDQDIALVKLDKPVTQIAPVALQCLSLTKKQHGLIPLVIVGTSGGRKALQGHRAYGIPPLMLRIPDEKLATGKGGDSGGAWILKQGDSSAALLIAVLSGGMQLDGREFGRGIQPAPYRQWIDKTLATTGDAAVWKEIPQNAVEEGLEFARKSATKRPTQERAPALSPSVSGDDKGSDE